MCELAKIVLLIILLNFLNHNGEGFKLQESNEEKIFSFMNVFPSHEISASSGEYVTVWLNVEYRHGSMCTINEIYSVWMEQSKFQRVGACGFRALADDIKDTIWNIIYGTKNMKNYSGKFVVHVKKNMKYISNIEMPKIQFYKDTRAIIPLDIFEKSYCIIKSPNNEIIHAVGPAYIINEKDKYDGSKVWMIKYFDDNNIEINEKKYSISFEDKITPGMNITQEKLSNNVLLIKLQCFVHFVKITQCSFHGPSGITINDDADYNGKEFDFQVTNLGTNDYSEYSTCELTIKNLTSNYEGKWECSIRDDKQIANGTTIIKDQSKLETVEIFQKIGTKFTINCTDNNQWEECSIEHLNGQFVYKTLNDLPNLLYNPWNTRNDDKICSLTIDQANKTLNGNWTCNVFYNNRKNIIEKKFIVHVSEDFARAEVKYKIFNGKNETILEARPFPTDNNNIKNITKCTWEHPVNNKYLENDFDYSITNHNNVCQLVIKYPQEYDNGNWSCTMTLISSAGALDTYVATFIVHDLQIYSKIWRYVIFLLAIIVLFLIIILVGWCFVSKVKNAKYQQQKKNCQTCFV